MEERRKPRVPWHNLDQHLYDKGYKKGYEEALQFGERRKKWNPLKLPSKIKI